ncbi:hypothetical protein PS627_04394 [Pseudomonas fluorescens]|uniref:DUF3077 domain-containing protein n=1 Tax=Pseudomonas fluorescens TaxID=294 RepID=UPI0012541DFE|nr:DUF3077 domain-containing protein [Pseudomonas fluorescens]CAG8871325.1 hypothetical protein PS627_04394 [Pseudomonas fluorescens]VVP82570.1 hypothetical protein PS910_02108 [Pseudomonas fluorescens]
MTRKTNHYKTTGVGTFGEGIGGCISDRLFKVAPGHDAEYALEQASVLLDCVYRMTLQAGVERDDILVWGAHYLSGMAKALVEDVTHGMMTGPVR